MFAKIRAAAKYAVVLSALVFAAVPAHATDYNLHFAGHVQGDGGQNLVNCWVNSVGPDGGQVHSFTGNFGNFNIYRAGQSGWYTVTAAYGSKIVSYKYYISASHTTISSIDYYLGNTN